MKNIFFRIIWVMLPFLSCQNKISVSQMNSRFEFKEVNTMNISKNFGQDFVNKLLKFSKAELSDVYIVEVQNLGLDSMFIPFNYSGEFPVYYSGQTKYFNSINDTVPIKVALPFNVPNNMYKLARNEKKCFLTPLSISKSIAKIDYYYYSTAEKKNLLTAEVILTKKNTKLIDMTRN